MLISRGLSFAQVGRRQWRLVAVLAVIALPAMALGANSLNAQVLQNTSEGIVVRFEFGEFSQSAVNIDGMAYTKLLMPRMAMVLDEGAPDLPYAGRSIIIPLDAEMGLRVVAAEYYEIQDILVAPSKGNLLRSVDPATVPYTFGAVYQQDAFYPGELAGLREPYIMRDFRGQVVEVFPFQYNPVTATLRVYTHLTVEVAPVGPGRVNVLTPRDTAMSQAFWHLYENHFLNFAEAASGSRYAPLDEEGDLLIICHDPWLPNLQPFVEHKNSIGISTTLIGVSQIPGGTTATHIKNYIQSVYDSSNLAFVLLVGDAQHVATPSASGGASDPTYAKLAGGDDYPDIMVGRFSAQSAADVDTQVLRTIEYEALPATQQDWFWKGVGIASNQGAGIGDEGQADHVHMAEIRGWLLAYGYTAVDEIYDPSASSSAVSAAVNAGRGIINYCGHGSPSSWGSSGFSTSHVNNLVNDNMLPFIISVACNNGEFDTYTTCFAEAWLRATNGSEPTGAIGCYASSISQSWAPPMEAQDEFNLLLCAETYVHYGTLCYAGSCSMMDAYGSGGVSQFNTWILFGDPSLRVVGVAYVPPLRMSLVGEPPRYISPGEPTVLTVRIEDGTEQLVSGSPTLHYRYFGDEYVAVPLEPLGELLYQGTLPPPSCAAAPEYYVSALGHEGSFVQIPDAEDMGSFTAVVATVTVFMDDDFEAERGWTVWNDPSLTTGAWERAVPANPYPASDFDGSGRCYVTDNRLGNYDVDWGPTILTSPMFDLSMATVVTFEYAAHVSCNFLAPPRVDYLYVEVSNDGGATWTEVDEVFPTEQWEYASVKLTDYIAPTAEVMVRFSIADIPNDSFTEAAVDAVLVYDISCREAGAGPGDMNCDGEINVFDIDPFVLALTDAAAYGAQYPNCIISNGDINGDGLVNAFDIAPFVELLTER
jgi:hypothetical protein